MKVSVADLRCHADAFRLCASVTDKVADMFESAAAAPDVGSRLLRLASLTESFLEASQATVSAVARWPSGDGRRLVEQYVIDLVRQVESGRVILIETLGELRHDAEED